MGSGYFTILRDYLLRNNYQQPNLPKKSWKIWNRDLSIIFLNIRQKQQVKTPPQSSKSPRPQWSLKPPQLPPNLDGSQPRQTPQPQIRSNLQECAILLLIFFVITITIFFFNFSKVDLFYYISLRSYSRGTLMELRTVLDLFLGHPCHLRSRGIFSFNYASLLFNYFIM